MFIIERCKREEYIKAWNYMYLFEKDKYNKNPLFDGINPSLNKTPLGSETDNFCTVAYDNEILLDEFKYGKPIGLFSFVVTPSKVIGKQYIVHPDYQGKGLGKALLIENEKTLKENGHDKYYIGCSICSASILQKYWKTEPFNSNVEKDLYKFNVDLNRENFAVLYHEIIVNNLYIEIANNDATAVLKEVDDVIILDEIPDEIPYIIPNLINDKIIKNNISFKTLPENIEMSVCNHIEHLDVPYSNNVEETDILSEDMVEKVKDIELTEIEKIAVEKLANTILESKDKKETKSFLKNKKAKDKVETKIKDKKVKKDKLKKSEISS